MTNGFKNLINDIVYDAVFNLSNLTININIINSNNIVFKDVDSLTTFYSSTHHLFDSCMNYYFLPMFHYNFLEDKSFRGFIVEFYDLTNKLLFSKEMFIKIRDPLFNAIRYVCEDYKKEQGDYIGKMLGVNVTDISDVEVVTEESDL